MTVFTYSRVPAFNPNTSPVSVAKSASGSVYDKGDTGFLTPLNLTLVASGTVTTTLVSDANGMFPDFTLVDRTECVFKSGSQMMALTTTTPIPGPTGTAGTAGKSITGAAVSAGNLVLTLSDSTALAPVPLPTGAAIDDSSAAYLIGNGTLTKGALNATFVPKWKATTAYLTGDKVLSPAGDVVSAKANFTSGASYNAANWDISATYTTPAQVATKLGTDAADSASPLRTTLSGAFASTSLFDRKRTPRPPMTILQGMTTGHAWTVPATTGTSNLNDTTDYALGDRSVTVTTPGDANLFNLVRVTAQTLDMTGKGIILWLKLVNAQNLRGWFIDIGDNTFTNYYRAQMNLPNGGKSPLYEGEWVPLWLPFSVFNYSKTGTPTKAGITAIRMYFGDAGTGAPVTLKVGGLATYTEGISRYPNGVASFTFDDSSAAQATFGAPYLAKYGFAGTMFPILSRLGTGGNYSIAQLRQTVDALGFELGAHASDDANHVTVVGRPQADIEAEFRKLRQWGFDNGFPSTMSYAYPIGPFDKPGVESVRKYFGYGRTNDGKNVSTTSPHRYSASAVVLGTSTTLAAAKLAVDAAIADKTWVNFVVHGLVTSAPGSNDWLQSDFAALVDYCAAQGIPCSPVGDVIAVL